MESIKVIERSINIDFSQQIRLSIFIDFRYNQLILSIVIECYRLSILSIAQVGKSILTGQKCQVSSLYCQPYIGEEVEKSLKNWFSLALLRTSEDVHRMFFYYITDQPT